MRHRGVDGRNIEIISDELALIWRKKTPDEKLSIAFSLWEMGQNLIYAHISALHPEWDEATRKKEVARRLSHGSS